MTYYPPILPRLSIRMPSSIQPRRRAKSSVEYNWICTFIQLATSLGSVLCVPSLSKIGNGLILWPGSMVLVRSGTVDPLMDIKMGPLMDI